MSRIKHECVQRITDAADIVEVITEHVHLKRAGTNYTACCPFHDEKSPSFMVSPAKQIYKCFGCGASGNAVKFVMSFKKLDFREAIETLGRKYGIEIEYDQNFDDEKYKAKIEEADQIIKVNEFALAKFKAALDGAPDEVKDYLDNRFTKDELLEYQIGYAPNAEKHLTTPLINSGNYQPGVAAGLIKESEGTGRDVLRHRITFPIMNREGRVVGFGARAMGDAKPKYLNSPENAAYQKSKVLYGLNIAAQAIQKDKYARLVEGYTDVITMHRHGYTNTIASCGTALTPEQVKLIKRYCSHVVITRDNDAAGVKAAGRDLEIFLTAGFKVEVCMLPEGEDPDSFLGMNTEQAPDLPKAEDGVMWFAAQKFAGTESDPFMRSEAINAIVDLLKLIPNALLQQEYLKKVCKTYKLKEPELRKMFATKKEEPKKQSIADLTGADYFVWPDELKEHKEALSKDLQEFGICMHGRMMYGRFGKEIPWELRAISNYEIEIVQHMFDEKYPKKLIRITNVLGETRIFDVMSDDINTIRGLDNAVTRQGNYLFWGMEQHFQGLRKKLFSEMDKGAMIEQLGYQSEGFWVTNTHVINRDGSVVKIDDHGIYRTEKQSYYIPSANKAYRTNDFKYHPQKKVVLTMSEISVHDYAALMAEVHREHSITALLYTIASAYSDIVYDRLKGFPLEFLYGKASTGKDNLIMACQALFGQPQAPLNLGNGASTMKAQIRKFAQFRNMVVNLSEYRRGDKRLNEYLKGLWGRDGYERGNIDSNFGTDTMPILSGVFVTGNDYPDDDALISRCVVEEFHKTDFTTEEKSAYKRLTATYNKGVSGLLVDVFKMRDHWEKSFPEFQERAEKEIKADIRVVGANERTFQNFGVIGASYQLMREHIRFPWQWSDALKHLTTLIEVQVRKQASGGKVSKFWDTFITCVRTKNDPLMNYQDFRVVGDRIYIQMSNVYGRMQNEWFRMNNEGAPAKSDMMELLRTDESYLKEDPSYRFGEGSNGRRSSAMVFRLDKTGIEGELLELLEYVDIRNAPRDQEYNFEKHGKKDGPKQGELQMSGEPEADVPF